MKEKKWSESTVCNVQAWHKSGKTKKWIMELYDLTLYQVNKILKQKL